jgi:hypothetical protein
MKNCSFEGCEREHNAKGYCRAHYAIWKKGKPLHVIRFKSGIKICSFEGCDRHNLAKGWCRAHYKQIYMYKSKGAPFPIRKRSCNKKAKEKCSVDNCDNFFRARGWCEKHYGRYRKHSDPLTCYIRARKSEYVSLDNILKNRGNYSKSDDAEVLRENFSDLYDQFDQDTSYF